MSRTVHVVPGAVTMRAARFGIAVALAFLVFGLVFAGVVLSEEGTHEPGLTVALSLFFLIWVGVCIGMVVTYARILSGKGPPAERSITDLQIEETPGPGDGSASPPDFETRLRKLEALRRDGLITEAEHQAKREELLREKW
jgi:hypothetical protein